MDGSVLTFSFVITLATALLFGLAPSIRAARPDLNVTLKGAEYTAGVWSRWMKGNVLVLLQFALATVLVANAALLCESFVNLYKVRLGFQPDHVLTAQFAIPGANYESRLASYQRLLDEMRATPGVVSAAVSNFLPFQGGNTSVPLVGAGGSGVAGEPVMADWRQVSEDYFKTLRIPLRSGRGFYDWDAQPSAPLVTVVSEEFAHRVWHGADAVGQQVSDGQVSYTVVGVVGNVRNLALNLEPAPTVYFPRLTWPSYSIAIRTEGDPNTALAVLRDKMRRIDPRLPIYGVRTLEQFIDGSSERPRVNSLFLAAFAGFALALGAIGVWGVTGYRVARRTREIGVRMALGAQGGDVVRMVVRQGMVPALAGIGLGMGGALAAARTLASLLYGVSAHDPWTLVAVTLVLALVALTACYLPARRAAGIDPMRSLRQE